MFLTNGMKATLIQNNSSTDYNSPYDDQDKKKCRHSSMSL